MNNTTTIAGPFKTKNEAEDTANALGGKTHSIYATSKNKLDEFGVEYTDFDDQEFYVERHNDIFPEKIFGYDAKEFMDRQYR